MEVSTTGANCPNPAGSCARARAATPIAARVPASFTGFNIYWALLFSSSNQGASTMRVRVHLLTLALAALLVAAVAGSAAAQTGRVGGTVKDEAGQPIKGASITAENPNASPSSFTATTDDKGRFSIIGLRTGRWTFSAQAPGYTPEAGQMNVQTIGAPNPPLTFTLKKGGGSAPASALGNLAAKDLQAELASADALYNAQKWDESIAAYRAIMAKAPALSAINLQIAAAYRNKKDYDSAI